ncbi:MAG: hypothetical protein AAF564_14560 [Bacteroidota bacterium]
MHLSAKKCVSAFFVLLLFVAMPVQAQLDLEKLNDLKARSIGPAGMSGRVTAIDAIVGKPDIIYIGTASGGLWKTTNGGTDFEPIFDDEPTHSIGAIAIYQKNPDIIYVGTGEGNPRNSANAGNGMYKSIDGGHTWQHLGLDDTRNIHRVFVHPNNPNIVYAGVQGAAWGDSEHRGVYKSVDGGESWDKILYVDDRTGVGDMVVDPSNPEKLMVAMWHFRRWPWTFTSGGETSGLYVSHDGGANWVQRTAKDGLPAGELGRLGLAIAPSNTNVVYALVEAKKNALYRSSDGGITFGMINNTDRVSNRPFYYNDLFVDPVNENRVYHLASGVQVSDDGGKSFKSILDDVHPDHHAWWIDPNNPNLIYNGNDGGFNISRDRGETWRFAENLPLAQFYHIRVDNSIPYRVCGGLQDNGSWCGPSQVWRAGGIRNTYWEEVAFGDGFDVMIHPDDPDVGYAMSQGGNLRRFELKTGFQKNVKPIHPEGKFLRFNWDAGIEQDPRDGNTIYYGSQYLHKSTDRGDTWTIISPDLTTNDPEKQQQLESGGLTYDVTGAENYTTITAIDPSPLEDGVIWVGTDDGNVQVTRDGGATWTNTSAAMKGLAQGAWVAQIQASLHTPGEAFAVLEDHRRNNWEPYLYRTKNYGRSWERLTASDDVWGFTLSLAQDPETPNLLFLGTEFGLYFSLDAGAAWHAFKNGVPTASVMDLALHHRDHDLVLGTFGRSVLIVDDIRPLRKMAVEGAALLDAPLTVFDAPDAYQAVYRQALGTRFAAQAIFAGENRKRGAMISYSVNPAAVNQMADAGTSSDVEEAGPNAGLEATMTEEDSKQEKAELTVEILNAAGEVIRTLEGPAKAGINRVYWEMRQKGIRFNFNPFFGEQDDDEDKAEPAGAVVLPGIYTARITYGEHSSETTINVKMDPRVEATLADLEARRLMYSNWEKDAHVFVQAVDQIKDARASIKAVESRMKGMDGEAVDALKKQGEALIEQLDVLSEQLAGKSVQGIRRDPGTVLSKLFAARGYIASGFDAPGESADIALAQSKAAMTAALNEVNSFFAGDWAMYQAAVQNAEVSLFKKHEALQLTGDSN